VSQFRWLAIHGAGFRRRPSSDQPQVEGLLAAPGSINASYLHGEALADIAAEAERLLECEPAIDGEIPREKRIPQQQDVHAATLISRLAMPRRSYPHPAPIFTQSSAALSAPGIEAEVFRFHAT
jgi:hypothetical protein